MLKRAYVEITNVCNLRCSFCPGTKRRQGFMTAEDFRSIAEKFRGAVQYLYLHVMGEPLLHPELAQILSTAAELGFRVCVTTNGTLLEKAGDTLLDCPTLHKVSVSVHSFEGNDGGDMRPYLESVWRFAEKLSQKGVIAALRLWNEGGAEERNGEVLSFLREKTEGMHWEEKRDGSFTLRERLFLERAEKFEWPDLSAPESGTEFCLGLRDQIAVLVDGTVVPCCLDHEGDIPLGNLLKEELEDILAGERAKAIYEGFSCRRPTEELCRRCGYASRFNRG